MNQRLPTWLSRLGERTQAEPPTTRHDSENEATTALFACSACEITYISEEMDACSTCGESVTQIPTERELPLNQSGMTGPPYDS